MKAAFFFSKKAQDSSLFNYYNKGVSRETNILQIDGEPFTEVRLLNDGEDVVSITAFDDVTLVKVVHDIDTSLYGSIKYSTGPLKGRVTINGITQ